MSERTRRLLGIEDLFRARWLDEPRLTRDGRRLAYSMSGLDRESNALTHWVCVDGRARPGRSPTWSPDGAQLAFVAARDGGEQIWLWDGRAADARALTASADPAALPCWSPDGRRVAFVSGRRVQVVDLDGHAAPLAEVGGEPAALCWLPDGRQVACAFLQDAGTVSHVHLLSVDGAPPGRSALIVGGPIRALVCAPDGRALAFIGHARGPAQGVNQGVFVLPLDGGGVRPLTATFDRCAGLTVRSDDARGLGPPDLAWVEHRGGPRIYFAYAEGASSHIGWAGLDGRVRPAVTGERACLSFSLAADADALAFVAADALDPGEVRLADRDGGAERAVTAVNADWLGELTLSVPRRLGVRADDGQAIDAWLMTPPPGAGQAPHPLIFQIHGGPHYPIGERFYFEFQRLAALGYAVAYSNPRGSQGYGEAFATCIRAAWGSRDYADLMSVLEAAAADGAVDLARMALTGVSYGAYMTHVIIARTERFRAAVTENGISDLVSNFAGTAGKAFWTWQLEGTPETQPERYRALSPLAQVERIRTPLLMIHAERDATCPIGQSEQMLAALRARGREAELVRIPEEGHMMNLVGSPDHRLMRAAAFDAWLARWLGGRLEAR